jgi:hypothetical protein
VCSTIPNDPPRFRAGNGDAQDLTQNTERSSDETRCRRGA